MVAHDKENWNISNYCTSQHEIEMLETIIVSNYTLLTDVYHFLQARSDRYPWVPFYGIRKKFFNKSTMVDLPQSSVLFDIAVKQAAF